MSFCLSTDYIYKQVFSAGALLREHQEPKMLMSNQEGPRELIAAQTRCERWPMRPNPQGLQNLQGASLSLVLGCGESWGWQDGWAGWGVGGGVACLPADGPPKFILQQVFGKRRVCSPREANWSLMGVLMGQTGGLFAGRIQLILTNCQIRGRKRQNGINTQEARFQTGHILYCYIFCSCYSLSLF